MEVRYIPIDFVYFMLLTDGYCMYLLGPTWKQDMAQSKYNLAPRGYGRNSFRFAESAFLLLYFSLLLFSLLCFV